MSHAATRTDRRREARSLLAPPQGRPHSVRRLPALLQAPRGPAGSCFVRARHNDEIVLTTYGRSRVLHRSDREEAAQPLPARHARAVVRHSRLQPRLQVLPEPGHLASRGRSTPWPTTRRRRPSPGGQGSAAAQRCLHVQRPGDLPRIRHRRRPGLPRSGIKSVAVTAGYISPEPRAEFFATSRGQRRSERLHRGLLSPVSTLASGS